MTGIKRKNIINAIQDVLEDGETPAGKPLNEWEQGFIEDMQKRLSNGQDLSVKRYDKLTDIIGFGFLK